VVDEDVDVDEDEDEAVRTKTRANALKYIVTKARGPARTSTEFD
jgi:hypothetical protein